MKIVIHFPVGAISESRLNSAIIGNRSSLLQKILRYVLDRLHQRGQITSSSVESGFLLLGFIVIVHYVSDRKSDFKRRSHPDFTPNFHISLMGSDYLV